MNGARERRLVYVVTDPMTVRCLLRGQLGAVRRQGYDVTVLCAPGAGLNEAAAAEGVSVETVPLVRRPAPLRDLRALWRLLVTLRRIHPDLVHASTPKAGLLGLLAARLLGVPARLYTLRGLPLESARGPRRWMLTAGERLAMRSAHLVLCVSESLRHRVKELELAPAEKLEVLGHGSSNGVDGDRFRPYRSSKQASELSQQLGLAEGEWVLGFVGRLTQDKGIGDLWLVFKKLRRRRRERLRLLLVGDFEKGDGLQKALRRELRQDPDCLLTGFVDDTAPYYALMDLLVFPSQREGFPNAPLEAAAASLPTVGYAATGTVDAVIDGETGSLVPLGDLEGLRRAIERYLEDDGWREEQGQAARRRVLAEFRPDSVWVELGAVYERLLEPSRLRPRAEPLPRRLADALLAFVGLVATSPLLVGISLAIALTMGPPILFRQTRPGKGGRPFTLLKFRTMRQAGDGDGRALPDSERLTRLGAFLRRTSLDELPELWNVLRGEMTFVGPRPLLPEYLQLYTREQARRHEVKPGITGWAQIHGRNDTTWEERLHQDVWYVDHRSLLLDLEILVRTFGLVLKGEGISAEGHATMPRFRGPR